MVLFTADTPSRREIEDLAIEARRLRPDAKIFIRTPEGAIHATRLRRDPRQLELDLEPEPPR